MAELRLLGVFEDRGQRDFHIGLVHSCSERLGLSAAVSPLLTNGCRFEFLREHLAIADKYDGVVVGVDGQKKSQESKEQALRTGLRKHGVEEPPTRVLWSIAFPSIEEWMMADPEALPTVLEEELGARRAATRPGAAKAERIAKDRLRNWTLQLVGETLLQHGLEYAEKVASRVDHHRIGRSRNPDLKRLLEKRLPEFLRRCAANPSQ